MLQAKDLPAPIATKKHAGATPVAWQRTAAWISQIVSSEETIVSSRETKIDRNVSPTTTIVSVKETLPSLSELLFPAQYRRKALALLLLTPDRAMHVREIARVTGSSPGTMKKELDQLERTGLLKKRRVGNQVQFSANTDHPVFPELAGVLTKSVGLADVVANVLAPLVGLIDVAFIFGSVARATESAASDIDVAIIGSVDFGTALNALHPAEALLQREISPAIYGRAEWIAKVASQSIFIQEILTRQKIFVIGTQHDLDLLGQSAEDRPT